MRKQLYWLSDSEWRRIEPLMPRGRRGAHRVDDRRIISGIVHMLRSGARWRDCPPDYGPYALTGSTGAVGTMSVYSTHIKAHRSAGGAKGGPSAPRSAARAAGARPKSTR